MMKKELKRPAFKAADVKVTERDMVYFSLGISDTAFVLPSERDDYRSDARAVALVKALKAGKDLSGGDFKGVNLKNADLSGGRFQGADFSGAVFYKTKARKADFSGADFSGAFLEEVDFSDADLTGARFDRAFARSLRLTGARVDEKAKKRFDALEALIEAIERGEIDLRHLSQSDLLCLDLRRLDLSRVNLSGLDLSMFVLEGVNLSGVYIDPKQLMSLEGLQHYHLTVRQLNEKKAEAAAREIMRQKQAEIAAYAWEKRFVAPPEVGERLLRAVQSDVPVADKAGPVVAGKRAKLRRPAVKNTREPALPWGVLSPKIKRAILDEDAREAAQAAKRLKAEQAPEQAVAQAEKTAESIAPTVAPAEQTNQADIVSQTREKNIAQGGAETSVTPSFEVSEKSRDFETTETAPLPAAEERFRDTQSVSGERAAPASKRVLAPDPSLVAGGLSPDVDEGFSSMEKTETPRENAGQTARPETVRDAVELQAAEEKASPSVEPDREDDADERDAREKKKGIPVTADDVVGTPPDAGEDDFVELKQVFVVKEPRERPTPVKITTQVVETPEPLPGFEKNSSVDGLVRPPIKKIKEKVADAPKTNVKNRM